MPVAGPRCQAEGCARAQAAHRGQVVTASLGQLSSLPTDGHRRISDPAGFQQ